MTPAAGFRYKGFISYSHAADRTLAPALQKGLERFAKPWYRLRAMRVFRDATGLAVTPALWSSIRRGLESSEFFVLLASPDAAASEWVRQEIDFWLTHRSAETLLIVVTDGVVAWDRERNDFDWSRTTALPRMLERRFREEPGHLDLTWARDRSDVSLRRPRFTDAVATLAATLRRVPLDDVIGEDVRQHRASRRMLTAALLLLTGVTAVVAYSLFVANRAARVAGTLDAERLEKQAAERRAADEKAKDVERRLKQEDDAARSKQVAATAIEQLSANRELAILLALEAVRISPTTEADSALRHALARDVRPVTFARDGESVAQAAFSKSGERLLARFRDGTTRIWTVARPSGSVTIPASAAMYSDADGVRAAFGPDSTVVLTVPYRELRTFLEPEGKQAAAKIWDAATGRLLRELNHPYVQFAAWSADGRRIVTVGDDARAVVWDAKTGASAGELEKYERPVSFVDFSADGRWVLTASQDDRVVVRRTTDLGAEATLTVPGKTLLEAAAFSPDGRWIVTVNSDDSARVWDWQRTTAISAFELKDANEYVRPAAFSPDSTRILSAGPGQTAHIWELATGRNTQTFRHDDQVGDASFSSDGRWIVTVSADGTAVVWDAASGHRLMDLGRFDSLPIVVAFSPNDRHILIGSTGGEVLMYPCEICGTSADLVTAAEARVKRALSAEERAKFLGDRK